MFFRITQFLCSFLLCIPLLHAQDPSYINYDTENGLPSSEVYDGEVGPDGHMWFSTDRGVCSYDGYIFKTYTTKDGLADNTNFEIFKDSKNRFWFLGFSSKLSIYENGQFSPYTYNTSLETQLTDYWISHIIEDNNGQFYVTPYSTAEVELYKFKVDSPPQKLDDRYIKDSLKIQYPEENPLVTIDEESFFYHLGLSKTNSIFPLVGQRWKNFMIHHANTTIYKTDTSGSIQQRYKCKNNIANFYIDESDAIWVNTTGGILYFENGDFNQPPDIYLQEYNITSLTKDLEGNFWATTLENGVLFIPSFKIKLFKTSKNQSKNEKFLSIAKLKEHIYFGSADSKLIAYNPDKAEHIVLIDNKQLNQIRYMNSRGNRIYANGHLLVEHPDSLSVTQLDIGSLYSHYLNNNDKIEFSRIGFSLQKPGQDKPTHSYKLKTPFTKKITKLIQDSKETIWIGTVSGLYTISNYDYKNTQPILLNDNDPFGRINDIYFDHHDNPWIATIGKGLFYKTDQKLFHITEKDGLNSDLVNHILLQNDSTIWVGTNKGLNVLNYQFKDDSLVYYNIKSLTTSDGLSSNFINDVDYWKGQIWLATNQGVCYFDPDILNRAAPVAPIAIDQFVVNDSSVAIDDHMVFDYKANDILINFTGINFRKETGRSFYRYRLIQDNETPPWFYTNEKNLRYNDLAPGKYTFEVSAQNKTGQWNNLPAALTFEIKPHFSQTVWFKISSILSIIGLAALIVFFQMRRVRHKQIDKLKLQQAQLRTREAELAALRNQMNPHFVFNSLNSIQNFIFKKDTEKANYYLSRFSGLMRKSLQYTRLDYITVKDELTFLKHYLELEVMRFPEQFDYQFDVEEDLPVDYLMVPSLLLQPILENVIKHAFKEKKEKGKVVISLKQERDDHLEIYITDNGCGTDLRQLSGEATSVWHKSLGIEIIKNRIALLNESKQKLKASVNFTNLGDIDPRQSGLQVHFTLPILYKT